MKRKRGLSLFLGSLSKADFLQLRLDVLRQRDAFACRRVEAHLDRLLRRAERHRVGLVKAHLVAEALRADAHHGTLDQHQLAGADLVMELDAERRDYGAEPARADLLEREARHLRKMPAGVVEAGRVVAHVHVAVDIALRRHDDRPVEVEPLLHQWRWDESRSSFAAYRSWSRRVVLCSSASASSARAASTLPSRSSATPSQKWNSWYSGARRTSWAKAARAALKSPASMAAMPRWKKWNGAWRSMCASSRSAAVASAGRPSFSSVSARLAQARVFSGSCSSTRLKASSAAMGCPRRR